MKKAKMLLATMPLCLALLVPIYASAQDHDRDEHHDSADHSNKKYYDKQHKDYHTWNADEDKNWQSYQDEHHQKHTDWDHASKRQQQEYWNSRHQQDSNERR
jgi:hypothetical protein